MSCDDPSTSEGLALQEIDTSIGKTGFGRELMNKRKWLVQPGTLACKRKIPGKGRDGKQWSGSMWLLWEEGKTCRLLGSSVIRDALQLLLLNLPLHQLHGSTGFCLSWGAILQHTPPAETILG